MRRCGVGMERATERVAPTSGWAFARLRFALLFPGGGGRGFSCAMHCLCAAAVGGAALCLCMGVKGDADTELSFSTAKLYRCHDTHFLSFALPLRCLGRQYNADAKLHCSVALRRISLALLCPCPAARFTGFPLCGEAMPMERYANPFLNEATLHPYCADRCSSMAKQNSATPGR